VNVRNLIHSMKIIYQILFVGLMESYILSFVPTNIIHLEKRWERVLWWSFSRGRKDRRTRSHISNGKNHKLGDAPCHPTVHIKLSVCISSNFVFWASFYFCINLECLCLFLCFLFAFLFLIKGPPPVGMLNEYEWAIGVKIKLSFEEKGK
jgi:hypothetical protein